MESTIHANTLCFPDMNQIRAELLEYQLDTISNELFVPRYFWYLHVWHSDLYLNQQNQMIILIIISSAE